MSFADRAKAAREDGAGGFVFPALTGWARLKGWKYGRNQKKNRMFTLDLKILEEGLEVQSIVMKGNAALLPADLKGKVIKQYICPHVEYQLNNLLAYLEDSGMDLGAMDENDPEMKDIQEALEYIEDQGQKIKFKLVPQEDNPSRYNLKFLEVQRVAEGAAESPAATPAATPAPAAAAPAPTPAAAPVAQEPTPAAAPVAQAVEPVAAAPVPTPTPEPVAGAKKKPWDR